MTIKIEKNIPTPTGRSWRKYPFSEMEVGDSFFVPECKLSKINGPAQGFRRRNPEVKFTIRKEGTGYRCWRIA